MADGSDAIADWPLLNALLNTASGASWVSIHHGGGVGHRPQHPCRAGHRRRRVGARRREARARADQRPRHGRHATRRCGLRPREGRRARAWAEGPDAGPGIGHRRRVALSAYCIHPDSERPGHAGEDGRRGCRMGRKRTDAVSATLITNIGELTTNVAAARGSVRDDARRGGPARRRTDRVGRTRRRGAAAQRNRGTASGTRHDAFRGGSSR